MLNDAAKSYIVSAILYERTITNKDNDTSFPEYYVGNHSEDIYGNCNG